MRFIFFIFLLAFSCPVFSQKTKPEKIILDTDFGNDCDDAGALAILHQMAYLGEAEILATMYPMNDEWGAAAIDAVNTYYGKSNIPIGTYKGDYVYKGKHNDFYNSALASTFPNDLKTGHNAPHAIVLYRKILLSQPDKSITIVVVGPQRLLADLLLSPSDSISKLNGMQLVKKKVKKLVSMGAEYPSGNEWNIRICPDGAKLVAEQWPTPIVYSGFEIGKPIMTGERLITETEKTNPVRVAFETNPMVDEKKNRHSWDETAVLYGVRGLKDYWTLSSGVLKISEDGKNSWIIPGKTHQYLIAKMPTLEIKKVIEDMMVAPP
ncbi:MAG TPA: nucleoside hydrolase, partial [Chryseolinea sp.]|nr:nucleoside hydrolase [Chryseolinea sp.]